jgi:cytochrome c
VKIGMDGSYEIMASGLRTPNGIGLGVEDEIFVADNQGDWVPSCKIVHIKKGSFYGSYSVDLYNIGKYIETPPVVWLPQGEIGLSASQPSVLNDGPYKGQMIHGDVTHGGLKRVFVEKIKGEYQGVVFPFSQGFSAGINRICWGPDGALYVGGVGSTGNWSQYNKKWYGLQKIKYTDKLTFEILAVRAKANGFELEFTEPVGGKSGNDVAAYEIQQWQYVPTMEYGGPKVDLEGLKVESVNFSPDRKKVFLEIPGLKTGYVQSISIPGAFQGASKQSLWANIGWYTLNNIPIEKGIVTAAKTTSAVGTVQKSKTPVVTPKLPTDPYRKMEASEEKTEILTGSKLIKPSGCNTCHAPDQKILGPSFKMVAQKYANDPATLKKLTEKIYKGGGGVWGEYAMAPQSHLKKENITKMVRYILSLK